MAFNTTTNSEALVAELLSRKVLDRVEPELTVHKLGMEAQIPKGESKTIRWVRYGSLAANVTPIPTEGTTPAESNITISDVTVIAQQYGAYTSVTDVMKDTSRFDNLKQAANILGDSAKKALEQLAINELDSNAAELFVNGAANEAALTATDYAELEDFIAAMQQQRVANLDPHTGDEYSVVLNKAITFDVLTDTTGVSWYDTMKRTQKGQDKVIKGELGSLFGMRFMESGLMSSVNNGLADIKYSYVLANEAFGTVDIASQGIKTLIAAGGPSDSDPLDQRRKVGYKFYNAVKYLDAGSKRCIIVKAAASN